MNKRLWQAFICLLVVLSSAPVKSEPRVQVEYKFYDIYPIDRKDLEEQIFQTTPIRYNGKKFAGLTQWRVSWKFNYQKINKGCRIDRVSSNLAVTYTMPRISQQYKINAKVRNSFDAYYATLLKHEEGHKDRALEAAKEIEQKLLSIGTFNSCKRLGEFANQKAYKIIEKYKDINREYDRQTNHGRTQGAAIERFSN